ncbi:hypothetical protein ACXR0O_17880 [Verrucomicrobiota bacterium sgz303538]
MLPRLSPTLGFALLTLALGAAAVAEDLPAGIPASYRLVYQQDFSKPEAIDDFAFTDRSAWKLSNTDGKPTLELVKQSDYKPQFRSPFNIARLEGKKFGDVIFEADCLQTGKEYGHRDMVFVYGYQSPSRFYYTHIATAADEHAHNCFIVNDAPRVKFAKQTTKGVNWGLDVWHKVRIERKASDGSVRVYFDDMKEPIMVAEDKTFGPGEIGFGSFDDTGKITNIRVYAPASESK